MTVLDELNYFLAIGDAIAFLILLNPAVNVLCYGRIKKPVFVVYILAFWLFTLSSALINGMNLINYTFWPDCKLTFLLYNSLNSLKNVRS